MSKALNLPENSGVLVSDVTKDTPAAKAGVKRGDVIMSVDDIKVRTTGELRNAIAASGATKTVRLRILRDGKEIIVPVALAEMPGKFADSSSTGNTPGGKAAPALGMELQPLTPELRKKLDVPAEINQGVVITDMDSRSEAARAGLRPGDVVLELNRTKVASPADLQRIWQSTKGNLLALVLRKGTTNYVVIKRSG
jgi:serine protease Do